MVQNEQRENNSPNSMTVGFCAHVLAASPDAFQLGGLAYTCNFTA